MVVAIDYRAQTLSLRAVLFVSAISTNDRCGKWRDYSCTGAPKLED